MQQAATRIGRPRGVPAAKGVNEHRSSRRKPMFKHSWRARACAVAAVTALAGLALPAGAQTADATPAQAADASQDGTQSEIARLPWQRGPLNGAVGGRAHLDLGQDLLLLSEGNGSRFLELSGNLPSPGETILMSRGWWATFSFDETGYVKDDEKLDADEILKSMRSHEEQSNAERRKRGFAELTTEGWIVKPHYDTTTKYLEWGVKLRASDSREPVVNYTMRLLGRHGVESVVLVTSPETLDHDVQELHQVLGGFTFDSGEKYGEFRPGDHVAEFGLGALVLGGAAAAAVKGGWFKGLLLALAAGWKLVAAAGIAVLAGLGKLVSRIFGRKTTS
jgi:uncharacterized membrane-anchored protein